MFNGSGNNDSDMIKISYRNYHEGGTTIVKLSRLIELHANPSFDNQGTIESLEAKVSSLTSLLDAILMQIPDKTLIIQEFCSKTPIVVTRVTNE